MAQYRNVTDETLYTVTPQGLVKVEPDSILTISDDFAASRYWQTGETGEPQIWEPVDQAPSRGKSSKKEPHPSTDSAVAAEEE